MNNTLSVWILLAVVSLIGSNALLLSPVAGEIAANIGATSAAQVVFASSLFGASTAAGALFLAPHADDWGLWRTLRFVMLGFALACFLTGSSTNLFSLYSGQIFAGLSSGLGLPIVYGLTARIAPKGRESVYLGRVLTGWTISLVFGVSGAALVADLLHWRANYLFLGAFSVVLAVLSHLQVTPDSEKKPRLGVQYRAALQAKGVMGLLACVFCFMGAFYGTYGYIGIHATQVLEQSTTQAGLIALVYGIGFAGTSLFDGVLDRLGPMRVGRVIFCVLLFVYAGLAFASQAWMSLLLMSFIWGGINHFGLNILIGQLNAAGAEYRSTVLGLNSAVTYFAVFVTTGIFGKVFVDFGFAYVALGGVILLLPAVTYLILGAKAVRA